MYKLNVVSKDMIPMDVNNKYDQIQAELKQPSIHVVKPRSVAFLEHRRTGFILLV